MSVDYFNPVCASGAQWYACPSDSSSKFVGCCASDPCGTKGCSQGNLESVAFNASMYGSYPDPMCGTGSQFYGCVNIPTNTSTFWGCCKSNPCAQEQKCPESDLVPAFMGQPGQFEWYAKESTASSSPTGSPTASPSVAADSEKGHSNTGVIAGATVGGVVLIVAIISLLVFGLCKRKKAKGSKALDNDHTAAATTTPGSEKYNYQHSQQLGDAPPGYSSPHMNNGIMSPVSPNPASGYPHHFQPVAQAPVEMPAENSYNAGGSQTYSELPAQSAPKAMAELDSPHPSPRPLYSEKGSPV